MPRPWLNSLIALLLALTPAAAQEFYPSAGFTLAGGSVPEPTTPTLFRATCATDTSNATTYSHTLTFTGVDDSWTVNVIVAIMGEDNAATFGVNSATFDGAAATEVIDEDGTGIVDAALYRLQMNGASSVVVAPTYSEALAGSSTACGWVIAGDAQAAPDSSVQDDDTASGALVLTTGTTNATGFTVGACITESTGSTTTWAVITEREDTCNAEHCYSNADATATGASMANTCDWTNTGDASGVAGAFH